MSKILYLFLALSITFSISAQTKVSKRPDYVIIINDEIVSKEQVSTYSKNGDIKSMNKGVSQKKRDELYNLHGDKIGDKQFIVTVILLTEFEKAERKRTKKKIVHPKRVAVQEFLLNINDVAKNFNVQMIDETTIELNELKGKVVLLNFWATWCAPCIMEFYDMPDKILNPFKESEFVFIPISIGESKEKVVKKMKKLAKDGINFSVGYDSNKAIWDLYASGSIPKNFLIDQNGVIQYVSTGYSEAGVDKLAIEIQKLLDKQ
ncbi:TlpA family protein disulfide reductase [Urechidicola vernalis]|uniref:TlpA disulfide reductase family protein n=1 Tax=Urechidicola vernalis TaxID=3075600 RepID=A0ABU2Y526_9FLAO|nr:TlpA disulfide reductase family protein [Urechidicola sp. P050]MDT0553294.1 TlpA disulfide reductase family protein [Urechidicola sp. P050]